MRSFLKAGTWIAVLGVGLGLGCAKIDWSSLDPNAQNGNTGSVTPDIKLSITDQQNNVVFNEEAQNSILLTTGQSYDFNIAITNSSSQFTLVSYWNRIDLVNPGPPTSVSFVVGDNQQMAPAAGDYAIKIVVSDANGAPQASRTYQASVTCANPQPLTLGSNPGITSTRNEDNNFTFTGRPEVSGGQRPYIYAVAIFGAQVTLFQPIGQSFDVYNNYYGPFVQLGIVVKDACNQSQTASANYNLGSAPGDLSTNIHLRMEITGNSGAAENFPDAAVGTLYIATNNSITSPVQSMFEPDGNGGAAFSMNSNMFQYTWNSVSFGLSISVAGFVINSNNQGIPQSIDATHAQLTAITYSTNSISDGRPALDVSSENCTLTGISAQILNSAGSPCSGSQNTTSAVTYTAQISGSYICNELDSSDGRASIQVKGDFEGMYQEFDNCPPLPLPPPPPGGSPPIQL